MSLFPQSAGTLRLGNTKIEWVSKQASAASSSQDDANASSTDDRKVLPLTDVADVDWTRLSRHNRLRVRTVLGMQLNFLNLKDDVALLFLLLFLFESVCVGWLDFLNTKKNSTLNLQDYEPIRQYFRAKKGKETLEKKSIAVSGKNWGAVDFDGDSALFLSVSLSFSAPPQNVLLCRRQEPRVQSR